MIQTWPVQTKWLLLVLVLPTIFLQYLFYELYLKMAKPIFDLSTKLDKKL